MTTTQTATQSPRGESISMLLSDASPLQVTGEGEGDNAGGRAREERARVWVGVERTIGSYETVPIDCHSSARKQHLTHKLRIRKQHLSKALRICTQCLTQVLLSCSKDMRCLVLLRCCFLDTQCLNQLLLSCSKNGLAYANMLHTFMIGSRVCGQIICFSLVTSLHFSFCSV
jgi:hypothetical protein